RGVQPMAVALPAALVASAVKAASAPSSRVVALTEGVLRAMFLSKLKGLLAAVLAVAVLGAGAGVLTYAPRAAEPPAKVEAPAEAKKAEPGPAPDTRALRATLLALEKKAWEAMQKRDFRALDRLTAEDYVAILDDGTRWTRTDLAKVLDDVHVKDY